MSIRQNKKARNSIFVVIVVTLLSFTTSAFAGTYWIDDNGTATWANCESSSPLSGASACSLSTANNNALAGDVINLRAGTYNTNIAPSNSGSNSGNRIAYQAYTGETPTITTASVPAIQLNGNDYIKINGITVANSYTLVSIERGSNYNEIVNCTLHGTSNIGDSGILIRSLNGSANTHNWIHNNTVYDSGFVDGTCNDQGGVVKIGGLAGDFTSNYNTIENNVLYWGGHHVLQTFSMYNVIRNNVFHNESWMTNPGGCSLPPDDNGKYGNRNIEIFDGNSRTAVYNFVEGNRIGHAGLPPDDNGASNLTITSPKNIIRYNYIYNAANDGLYFKQAAGADSDNNRAYNNTIYRSGYGPANRTELRRTGVSIANGSSNNVIKNNIVYDSNKADCYSLVVGDDCNTVNIFTNNWLTADGNPGFVNTDVSDPASTTLPDLSLQSGSGAIDKGTYLTQANGSGSNSTTLIVDDALYFQDGTWGSALSNMEADWIAIGTVSNVVQISSINYSTNTITLASPMTWSDNANIWLYKKSDGTQVLYGSAPDYGAYELNPDAPTVQITQPTSNGTYTTTDATINLSGTANDPGGTNIGITSVTWSNNATGGSGNCSGTTSWFCNSIPLQSGQNVITVTATDGDGNTATDVLVATVTTSGGSDTGGNTGGGDSSASGGSGCGFVKDSNSNRVSKSQSGRVTDIGLMIILIITLAGIAIVREIFYKFNRNL